MLESNKGIFEYLWSENIRLFKEINDKSDDVQIMYIHKLFRNTKYMIDDLSLRNARLG